MNASNANAADVLQKNSRSFSIAARFLPKRVRHKVTQLYAWCRAVDDAVDHAESQIAAREELDRLEQDLRYLTDLRCQSGDQGFGDVGLQHPASNWIAPLILAGDIAVCDAVDLIAGMRMDLDIDGGHWSIDREQELLHYCYHAAGTVGLMMTQIMGVRDPAARSHAVALGVAMQLTNIARDVREDADRGRCYLPGIASVNDASDSSIRQAVHKTLMLAERRYQTAEAGLKFLPIDCRRAIRVALAAYREIGRELMRRDCDVMAGRTVVPKLRLLSVVSQAAFSGAFPMSEVSNPSVDSTSVSQTTSSISQCKSAVWLGLSLTAFMATALFVMVYMNPKSDVYSTLPLLYATGSLVFAVAANRVSVRYEN
ncbi:All-trans-phytoene synthase/15-cis-phytoene synthase [Rubripirellula obstinata]|uniref:All-trans-phytoene synthase/15-cis-phytoene synthase n=1 Tax=Rubripirellula obstinata TaxID=406547 RepID=A0A5B1CGN0_9BACT|nr:phytoene/squalene synthase family protein [Rubripirellula obstinata]KAA1258683.1 All-trans-phytoene synthase/15-cis-phytoene synthase [Rubripirellula obstinata]